MKMILKLLIVCVLCLVTIGILYFIGIFIYASITEFKPAQVEALTTAKKGVQTIPTDKELSLLSWNIGYAGLGAEMDFFYEGGDMVQPTELQNNEYLKGIIDFVSQNDSIDFLLFQEVDFDSKRSHYSNQSDLLHSILKDYNKIQTFNYKSKYIPIPFMNPMGKVNSGLVTFSKYSSSESHRISTPGSYSWPKRLFMLKRCFLVTRFKVENRKELILFNIHNSAFDDADELRKEELKLLKELIENEFEAGNYVIVGGDWNQNPPGSDIRSIKDYISKEVWPIEKNYLSNIWGWAFDPHVPTNRDVSEAFEKSTTKTTILDFFLVSPNIEIIEPRTVDLGFEYSDHQPSITKIILK